MHRSVSRWRSKEEQQQELEQLVSEMMSNMPPGSRGVNVFFPPLMSAR